MTDAIVGVLLAAGAGTRMGRPKALVRDGRSGEPWVATGARMLRATGCGRVVVVLGARSEEARTLVPVEPWTEVVVAPDWAEGLSASLRAGLAAAEPSRSSAPAATGSPDAALVSLVDLPELPVTAACRVVRAGFDAAGADPRRALARATYHGRPGHPVLLGRDHWTGVAASVTGDSGAGAYLTTHDAFAVECGDLWSGRDRDR